MKQCLRCKEIKDHSCFAKHAARKDGLQSYCRPCKKVMDQEYYLSDKAGQFDRIYKYRRELKEWLDKQKSESGCSYCEEGDPCCLDFHHVEGDKLDNVSAMIKSNGRAALEQEIAKCVVVCANCHRKLHAGRELHTKQTSSS